MSDSKLRVQDLPGQTERTPSAQPPVRGLRRAVYLVLGAIFFALGAIGVILPGLPTTPFLLLTSFFLLRASPRLNQRMLQSRMFGPILTDWQQRGGVRRHVKVKAIGAVLIALGLMVWLSPMPTAGKVGACIAGVIGLIVIFRLREV